MIQKIKIPIGSGTLLPGGDNLLLIISNLENLYTFCLFQNKHDISIRKLFTEDVLVSVKMLYVNK